MHKIMVIDDNQEFLSLMEAWLQGEEFEVCLCADAQNAAKIAASERPSIILLDLLMPSKPGIEVLAELKVDYSTRQIPVMVLTAASKQAKETELQIKRLADELLPKPFDFEQLLSKLRHYLDESNNDRAIG